MFPTPEIINNMPDIILPATNWRSAVFWSPLIVAFFTLGGVIATNLWTGKNMIRAENRRHENVLNQRTLEWQRSAKAEIYAEVIARFEKLRLISRAAMVHASPSASDPKKSSDAASLTAKVKEFEEVSEVINMQLARITVIGDQVVSDAARKCGNTMHETLHGALLLAKANPSEYSLESVASSINRAYRTEIERLVPLMREGILGYEVSQEQLENPVSERSAEDENGNAGLREPSPDPH